jgi:hypothetical protein
MKRYNYTRIFYHVRLLVKTILTTQAMISSTNMTILILYNYMGRYIYTQTFYHVILLVKALLTNKLNFCETWINYSR